MAYFSLVCCMNAVSCNDFLKARESGWGFPINFLLHIGKCTTWSFFSTAGWTTLKVEHLGNIKTSHRVAVHDLKSFVPVFCLKHSNDLLPLKLTEAMMCTIYYAHFLFVFWRGMLMHASQLWPSIIDCQEWCLYLNNDILWVLHQPRSVLKISFCMHQWG